MTGKMVVSGGGRISNIEALRLLSMLMVLNLHSFKGYDCGDGVLQALDFFRESTSICAVNVFILISGFFSIKWKLKSFYKLVFSLFFYSFSIYAVCVIIGVHPFHLKKFALCFFAMSFSWGFVRNYLILYFFAPLLNSFTDNHNNKTLFVFIVILFFAENFIFISYDAINFLEMYLIGRLIKKTNAVELLKYNASKFYWITTIVIFLVSYTLFLLFHLNAETMTSFFLAYSYASPFVILQAVSLFLVFARMRFESRFVNWCAASSLAIFLIHMHPSIKEIYFHLFDEHKIKKDFEILQYILYFYYHLCKISFDLFFVLLLLSLELNCYLCLDYILQCL